MIHKKSNSMGERMVAGTEATRIRSVLSMEPPGVPTNELDGARDLEGGEELELLLQVHVGDINAKDNRRRVRRAARGRSVNGVCTWETSASGRGPIGAGR